MKRRIIKTEQAPEPIGPYSQAIQYDQLLFTSGQIAIDPHSEELLSGDVEAQTRQVLQNLQAILEAAGASLKTVLKTTIYLKNMDDFSRVNAIYATFFAESLPARSTIEVARLPKDMLVEIDCVAVVHNENLS
jgi:2-iminobutanoate/2-iminopropanoate deaminase